MVSKTLHNFQCRMANWMEILINFDFDVDLICLAEIKAIIHSLIIFYTYIFFIFCGNVSVIVYQRVIFLLLLWSKHKQFGTTVVEVVEYVSNFHGRKRTCFIYFTKNIVNIICKQL